MLRFSPMFRFPRRHRLRSVPVLCVAILVAGGCAGELEPGAFTRADAAADFYSTVSYTDTGPQGTDSIPTSADSTPATADATVFPDTRKPDSATIKPPGPCPCGSNALCISGKCYPTCNPSGACGVTSGCGASEACLLTTAKIWVCVPAKASPGKTCGKLSYCPNNHVCGTMDGKTYRCLPICSTTSASCGSGGTCYSTSLGCKFCSST